MFLNQLAAKKEMKINQKNGQPLLINKIDRSFTKFSRLFRYVVSER